MNLDLLIGEIFNESFVSTHRAYLLMRNGELIPVRWMHRDKMWELFPELEENLKKQYKKTYGTNLGLGEHDTEHWLHDQTKNFAKQNGIFYVVVLSPTVLVRSNPTDLNNSQKRSLKDFIIINKYNEKIHYDDRD